MDADLDARRRIVDICDFRALESCMSLSLKKLKVEIFAYSCARDRSEIGSKVQCTLSPIRARRAHKQSGSREDED